MTATVQEINNLAAQIFEITTYMSNLVAQKPKRVFNLLSAQYQIHLERQYGENILR